MPHGRSAVSLLAARAVAVAVLGLSCSRGELAPPPIEGAIEIEETTVGHVDGYSVAVSNLWARPVVDDAGVARDAPTGQLSIWREGGPGVRREIVHEGSEVAIGDGRYRVLRVWTPRARRGALALGKASP